MDRQEVSAPRRVAAGVRNWLPAPAKAALRPLWHTVHGLYRRAHLYRLGRRLRSVPPGQVPDLRLLERLRAAWGNEAWSGEVEYLGEIYSRASTADAPILECGSGLTTFVLAIASEGTGTRVDVLEHGAEWIRLLDRSFGLERHENVRVHHVDLKRFDGYDWYGFEPPAAYTYGLVICDGPPGDTKGGRYGLLPVMVPALAAGSTILFDDAEREAESEILRRWEREFHVEWELCSVETRAYARVRLPRSIEAA